MSEGKKSDTGKLRYDLIPPRPLEWLAEVYTIGCKKYDDRNWEKGISWGRIFAAMMRHAWKWWRGEKYDAEDGQHHLASVAWCAFALMEYEETHPELDDRSVPANDSPRTVTGLRPGGVIPVDSKDRVVVTLPNGDTIKIPAREVITAISDARAPSK